MVKPYTMRPVIYKPFHGLLILRITNSPSSVSTESISSSAFRPLTNRNLLINLTDWDPRKATSTDCRRQLMTMLWNMRSPALVIRKTRTMMCYVRNRSQCNSPISWMRPVEKYGAPETLPWKKGAHASQTISRTKTMRYLRALLAQTNYIDANVLCQTSATLHGKMQRITAWTRSRKQTLVNYAQLWE